MKERGQRKMFSCQKHFSKVNPVQNDNNNNKIVVKKFKRASSSASNLSGNEEGAMTLEASLIVPIFLIVLLMLTSAGEILMIHQQISHGACEAAKRAAVNEYRIRQKKKSGSDLSGFSAKAAFLAAVNRKFLDHSALIGGSAGAAAACRLTLTSKGEYIVSVRYYIRKTMPFLSTHIVSYEQSVRQKSMTGYVPDGDELKKGYVYITPHEAVYHKDLSCTHLSLDISVDEDVEKYRNKRTQYKPCDKCTKHEKGDFSCVYIAKEGESYHTDLGCSGLKRTVKQVDLSTLKGMRPCTRCATGGYMTVEISALLPIILMVLWMFFSYLFYFMNCGIAQGIMEEAVQKAADVKITGAEYDTGKLSYQKVNQKLITGNVISSNKSGNTKAEKEMKEQSRRHLFMAEVSSVRVSTTPLRVSAKIKTRSAVVAGDFLSIFGICLFEYEGNDQAQGDFEIDQIRRWNALEGAMD